MTSCSWTHTQTLGDKVQRTLDLLSTKWEKVLPPKNRNCESREQNVRFFKIVVLRRLLFGGNRKERVVFPSLSSTSSKRKK
jgi:hypothetical protein